MSCQLSKFQPFYPSEYVEAVSAEYAAKIDDVLVHVIHYDKTVGFVVQKVKWNDMLADLAKDLDYNDSNEPDYFSDSDDFNDDSNDDGDAYGDDIGILFRKRGKGHKKGRKTRWVYF
jgi:hypothetical protein